TLAIVLTLTRTASLFKVGLTSHQRAQEPRGRAARDDGEEPPGESPLPDEAEDGQAERRQGGRKRTRSRPRSLADHLDQHALGPAAVELPVEDLLPGAEVQLAPGHRHHHLPAHDLPLVVGVAVVLAGAVVVIA